MDLISFRDLLAVINIRDKYTLKAILTYSKTFANLSPKKRTLYHGRLMRQENLG